MRDLSKFRHRLLLAMGFASTATFAACGTTATTSTVADAVVADTATDTTKPTGDVGADVASDVQGNDAQTTDVQAIDAQTHDVGLPDGGATDVGVGDAGATDAGTTDAGTTDAGGTDGSALVDAADAAPLPMPTCAVGKASVQCFSAKALTQNVDLAFLDGGAIPPDKIDFLLPPEGCPPAERVFEGCCNKAVSGPALVGDTCCYGFCVGACCGRPLRIAGAARVAPLQPGREWLGAEGAETLDSSPLSATTRAAIAHAWREDARMEHASIASFNQFSLQLLAVGAPADLVRDAQRAALDEVEHAERCFAVAATVSGRADGPSALPLQDFRVGGSLAEAAASAAMEGCVGETLAALLAGARARQAELPLVRDALTVIAADEARHAELGWRFVRWALAQAAATGDTRVRAAVRDAFVLALADLPSPRMPAGIEATDWTTWGLLDPAMHQQTVRAAVRQVIGPCVDTLLGEAVWAGSDRCKTFAQRASA